MRKSIALPLVVLALAGLGLGVRATSPPNLEEAIEVQRQLVIDRSSDPTAHNDLGNLLSLAGYSQEAEDAYRQAIALDPMLASAHYNLGLLFGQNDKASKALDAFKEAVTAEPDHAWAWFQIGWLYEQKNQRRRAVGAYSRALSLDPNLGIPQVNPQVLDSAWITEAMMKAYKTTPQGVNAPKSFSDSERIRSVMIGPVPEASSTNTVDPGENSETAGSQARAGAPRRPIAGNSVAFGEGGEEGDEDSGETVALAPSDVEPTPATEPKTVRVIGPQDLDRKGRVNQASPPTSTGDSGFSMPNRDPQVRTWTPPSRRTTPTNSAPQAQDGRTFPRPQAPEANSDSGRVRYRPGVSSSGRSSTGIGGGGNP